ncbi:hypothetical protein BDF14DRAFT_1730514 [Spinellus fusiger]|nr:hypothetical protein BDF14DRAFT_1730514 [Spinellus fusiger]
MIYPELEFIKQNTFLDFWNHQASKYEDNVFLRYADKINDGSETFRTLTYRQVNTITTNIACELHETVKDCESIGFIEDHSVSYMIYFLAIIKLRSIFIALSPRNSNEADANILQKTNSKLLVASVKYSKKAQTTADMVENCRVYIFPALDIAAEAKKMINPNADYLLKSTLENDSSTVIIILHSSGSTGLPKPIYLTNYYILNQSQFFHYLTKDFNPDKQFDSSDVIFSHFPLFHIFGLIYNICAIVLGCSAVFEKNLLLSTEELLFALKFNKCTLMALPPLILEQLSIYSNNNNDYSVLQQPKQIVYSGAPLRKDITKSFRENKVNICATYGSTETGAMLMSDITYKSPNWEAFRLISVAKDYCVFEPYGEDSQTKHLVIKSTYPRLAAGICSEDTQSYNTNDIFFEDPKYPGCYNYVSRIDDILVMKNGEKTNPLLIEADLRTCAIIKQCVVFGEDRTFVGTLIELSPEKCQNYSSDEIMEIVYSAVDAANKKAPSHSIIFKPMVRILPLGSHLPTTDKNSIIRKRANIQFKDTIDHMYTDYLDKQTVSNTSLSIDSSSWSQQQIKTYLVETSANVLNLKSNELENTDQDLFDYGLDSILSIELRNKISHAFDNLPQDFLYQCPTINLMLEFLTSKATNDISHSAKEHIRTNKILEDYLLRADASFSVATYDSAIMKDQVVLLTGATGFLGSFLLAKLIREPSVKKIYCLVRSQGSKALDRIVTSFEKWSLDTELLQSPKVAALPVNLKDKMLGFSKTDYDVMKSEVTVIQHCAWVLDFNQYIDFYEKECIQGLFNLLEFSYRKRNPIHFHFVSSVSASAGWMQVIPESPLPKSSKVTMPMGYARSKYIAEHLLNYLAEEKHLPCYIERLGQIYGDTVNGAWSTAEQYPMMFIGGGSVMGKMPSMNTTIDWISVDHAANSMVDIMIKTIENPTHSEQFIYHIVNPNRITWGEVLNLMKGCGMQFDVVTPSEWVAELGKDDKNPAYKLKSFYTNCFDEMITMPTWDTSKTVALSPSLAKAPAMNLDLFKKFFFYWKSVGFYK